MSGRTRQRLRVKRLAFFDACLALVKLAELAGPNPTFRRSKSIAGFRALAAKAVGAITFNLTSPLYSSSGRERDLFQTPKQLVTLWISSAQRPVVSLRTAARNVLRSSLSFRRRLPPQASVAVSPLRAILPSPADLLKLPASAFSNYLSSVHTKLQDACPLQAGMVALPPAGHKPVPLLHVLPEPVRSLFASGADLIFRDPLAVFAKKIKPFSNFLAPGEKFSLFKNMKDASMMEFWPIERRPRALGGMFGVWKIVGESMRLLADVRPANFLLTDMAGVRK